MSQTVARVKRRAAYFARRFAQRLDPQPEMIFQPSSGSYQITLPGRRGTPGMPLANMHFGEGIGAGVSAVTSDHIVDTRPRRSD